MSDITERIGKILDANRGKDFVERIINPWDSPTIPYGDGQRASHQMSWGEGDLNDDRNTDKNSPGYKYYVYPNIMRDEGGEDLEDYSDNAWDEAYKRGEYIQFDTAEEANWFSQQYKQVWPEGMR
jgi:hypothetical protein